MLKCNKFMTAGFISNCRQRGRERARFNNSGFYHKTQSVVSWAKSNNKACCLIVASHSKSPFIKLLKEEVYFCNWRLVSIFVSSFDLIF